MAILQKMSLNLINRAQTYICSKNEQPVALLLKTGLNYVLLLTFFIVVNNILFSIVTSDSDSIRLRQIIDLWATGNDILRESSTITVLSFSYKLFLQDFILNVQQSEQALFTKLDAMRMLGVLFVVQHCF